jgi:hypothetical protein
MASSPRPCLLCRLPRASSPPPPSPCHYLPRKHQIRRDAMTTANETRSRHTSGHHRDRDHKLGPASRARSFSPPRAETHRRRRRSPSPRPPNDSPPRHQTDKRPRDGSRRPRKDKTEFFQLGAGPRGGVCAACLGRHDHAFGKCSGHKLWDGSDGAARKTEQGKLVGADGLPICYDWQLPKGCQSALHPNHHKCSGCGKLGHGAQACPQAEKA